MCSSDLSPQAPEQRPVATTTAPAPSSLILPVPFKHERPFLTGGRGATVWYATESPRDISSPPSGLQVVAGTLYIHTNTVKDLRQIWMFDTDAGWKMVSDVAQTSHPSCRDRLLNIRFDGTPSWVTSTPATGGTSRRVKK